MATGKDPILEELGVAHLGSPKALLGRGEMLGEFRDFAMRGNMLDMAVGIIVGAAFGRVVSSFVSDVLMPPVSLFTGRSDFSGRFINLSGHAYATLAEAKAASSGHSELRSVSECCSRLLDRCVRSVHAHPTGKPPEGQARIAG